MAGLGSGLERVQAGVDVRDARDRGVRRVPEERTAHGARRVVGGVAAGTDGGVVAGMKVVVAQILGDPRDGSDVHLRARLVRLRARLVRLRARLVRHLLAVQLRHGTRQVGLGLGLGLGRDPVARLRGLGARHPGTLRRGHTFVSTFGPPVRGVAEGRVRVARRAGGSSRARPRKPRAETRRAIAPSRGGERARHGTRPRARFKTPRSGAPEENDVDARATCDKSAESDSASSFQVRGVSSPPTTLRSAPLPLRSFPPILQGSSKRVLQVFFPSPPGRPPPPPPPPPPTSRPLAMTP